MGCYFSRHYCCSLAVGLEKGEVALVVNGFGEALDYMVAPAELDALSEGLEGGGPVVGEGFASL